MAFIWAVCSSLSRGDSPVCSDFSVSCGACSPDRVPGWCADRRRPELDSAMRRARRDGQQNMYWTKKLLDFEERDPDR